MCVFFSFFFSSFLSLYFSLSLPPQLSFLSLTLFPISLSYRIPIFIGEVVSLTLLDRLVESTNDHIVSLFLNVE